MSTTVKDRAKIRAALSILALSVTMGVDNSIFEGTQSVVAVPIEQETKKKKEVSVKVFGNVKQASVEKVKEMLTSYLDNTEYVDNCIIVEGDDVRTFTKGKLNIPDYKLKGGEKISNSKDVNIYVAENTIDIDIPSVALSINQYFRERSGVR